MKIKNEKDFLQFLLSIQDESHIIDLNVAVKKCRLRPKIAINYLNALSAKGYLWYHDLHHSRIVKFE